MSAFMGAVVNGLVLGMAYALIAVGYSFRNTSFISRQDSFGTIT